MVLAGDESGEDAVFVLDFLGNKQDVFPDDGFSFVDSGGDILVGCCCGLRGK
jgi:hypothetical protein